MGEAQEIAQYLVCFKKLASVGGYFNPDGTSGEMLQEFIQYRELAQSVSGEGMPLVFIPDGDTSLWYFGLCSAVEFHEAILWQKEVPPTLAGRLHERAAFAFYRLPPVSVEVECKKFDFKKADSGSRLMVTLEFPGAKPKTVILNAAGANVTRLWQVVQTVTASSHP